MGSKNVIPAISNVLVVLMLVGFAKSDFQQDRAECADQLVGLATCLPYVGGDAKAPSLDCCSGLKQVLDKSEKCLCVLIKDRNDPNLGLKINATLAATLPSACHAPVNVTDCINLLHLPAGSPDAKVFEGFANMTKGSVSSPATSGNSTSSKSSSSAEKSDGDQRAANGWHDIILTKIMCGLIIWAFNSFGM